MGTPDNLAQTMAYSSMGYILLVLVCIALAWWGLQQFRFDMLLRNPRSAPSKILQIFLSIALGYQVAKFIIEYLGWAAVLKVLF
jgi:uncharacterized integral membrane protein (TIGR02327 family)